MPRTPSKVPSASGRPRAVATRRSAPQDLVLHVALADISPPIWRRVRVPDRLTLHQLHRVLQLVFGWMDYHLYEFRPVEEARGRRPRGQPVDETPRLRWALPDPEWDDPTLVETRDSRTTTLRDLALARGAELAYVYDFGDDWLHHIRVEKVSPSRDPDGALPSLLDGARNGPPEDAGGRPGYERLLEVLADPEREEHAETRDWAASWHGVPYDPERFERVALNHALMLMGAWGAF